MIQSSIVPIPEVDVSVRVATADDVPFIDQLQKKHSRMVGFMQTKAIEGKIAAGEVLIAEEGFANCDLQFAIEEGAAAASQSQLANRKSKMPVGYAIGTDRYFKHDDVGIIYQLNVAPGNQRGFVGATLLKAMFDRAAYGCRLFCCWCAQDIEANRFWEAMGFVPLAYRAGSAKKARVHIFWQKRIRSGDAETPWWFPSQTSGGSIREDRLVLPIPPGTHWSEAKAVVLPGVERADEPKKLAGPRAAKAPAPPAKREPISRMSGLSFAAPAGPLNVERPKREREPKSTRGERRRTKNDPKLVAAARELKDRWLEHLNRGGEELLPMGKYDVSRMLPHPTGMRSHVVGPRLLPHAA